MRETRIANILECLESPYQPEYEHAHRYAFKRKKLLFCENITLFSQQYMNCETSYRGKALIVDDYELLTQEKIEKRRLIINNIESDIQFIDLEGLDIKYRRLTTASDYIIVLRNQKKKH